MCSEHLSTRLRISKIIRSSKQRGGLGQSPANLFDLTSHIAKSTWNWEKQAVESELWKQNWGLPGFHSAGTGWGVDKAGWAVAAAASKLPQSAEHLPAAVGSSWPPGILQHSSTAMCSLLEGVGGALMASVPRCVSQSLLVASLQ